MVKVKSCIIGSYKSNVFVASIYFIINVSIVYGTNFITQTIIPKVVLLCEQITLMTIYKSQNSQTVGKIAKHIQFNKKPHYDKMYVEHFV